MPTTVATHATLTAFLPRRHVRVELLLLLGGQDRPHGRNLALALLGHLRAERRHLRPRRRRITLLARRARFLHCRGELLAVLLHLRPLRLAHRRELSLLRVRQRDALEQCSIGTATATHTAVTSLTPVAALGPLGTSRVGARLRGNGARRTD